MSKLKSNEKGFSAVELVLVVVIVALIGVVGWLVYKNHKDNEAKAAPVSAVSTTKTATTSKSSSSDKTSTTSTNSSSQQYLDITQLGIKLPLSSAISDLSYSWDGNNANLTSATYYNYVKQQDPQCANGATESTLYLGQINTSTTPPPDNSPKSVVVNNKTYYFFGPQDGCDPSQAGGSNVNTYTQSFEAAIDTAFQKAQVD